jgi:hypothetical protein
MSVGRTIGGAVTVAALLATLAGGGRAQAPQGPLGPQKKPAASESEPLRLPVEEIIRQFAAKEAEFKEARDNFTYMQSVRVQEFDSFGKRGGEFTRTSEIIFTPEGRRYEKIVREPPATLKLISMSREDLQDLENIQPFVLTTSELPKYRIEYAGREQVDEISTYVFRVAPKRIEKGERYFEGTIWVDDQDLQIVKTRGKAVPDLRQGGQENLFPTFETYRENIDGKYWFPTYTRADDRLRFKSGEVRIVMLVRYTNYRRFGSTARITGVEEVKPPPKPPQP